MAYPINTSSAFWAALLAAVLAAGVAVLAAGVAVLAADAAVLAAGVAVLAAGLAVLAAGLAVLADLYFVSYTRCALSFASMSSLLLRFN